MRRIMPERTHGSNRATSGFRQTAASDDFLINQSRWAKRSSHRLIVHRVEAEARREPLHPLEVVEKRPLVVAPDARPRRHRRLYLLDMALEKGRAKFVIGVGDTVLGDVERNI